MDCRQFSIGLIKGAGPAALAILALFFLLLVRGPWCWGCKGTGGYVEKDAVWICPDCDGSGRGSHLNLQLRKHWDDDLRVALIRRGETLWESDLSALPTVAWLSGGAVVLLGLFVGLRALACPLCSRQGTLLLELEPPGTEPKQQSVECPACEGRGTLTRLDCWIAGV